MNQATLHIKNMVCPRCVRVVKEELGRLGLKVSCVTLGEAKIEYGEAVDPAALKATVKAALEQNGFELLESDTARVIEEVKRLIIELVQSGKVREMTVNLSVYVEQETGKDYHALSSLFSSVESMTIERFFILQRIERAKELLVYDELSLGEIAYRLGYSSTAHLSSQFKHFTGISPKAFKGLRESGRLPLDGVHEDKARPHRK